MPESIINTEFSPNAIFLTIADLDNRMTSLRICIGIVILENIPGLRRRSGFLRAISTFADLLEMSNTGLTSATLPEKGSSQLST